MQDALFRLKTIVFAEHDVITTLKLGAAVICLIWYIIVVSVCSIGYTQIWRYFSTRPEPARWIKDEAPPVTVIRPVKGLEPSLYDCLASTFRQDYPTDKLQVRLCVSNRDDPSFPVLKRIVRDFSSFDVSILVEDEDPNLVDGSLKLGPNPKIRNMSRAYREATGDIVWIIDCNVWVGRGVCGRMVSKLTGHGSKQRYKFVHLLPIVVDTVGTSTQEETSGKAQPTNGHIVRRTSSGSQSNPGPQIRTMSSIGGGRLEELFLASSHPKFYTAINTVLIAPCIVGKSTMFRRSHLNALTEQKGIDYFSQNICEDHLIGDILWKKKLPGERSADRWGKHAMVFGDLAIQPMANMSVVEYWKRRVRWLRVRKFTVTLATLVEPGTESFLCSLYGAFAVTTLPLFQQKLSISPTWTTFATFWLLSVSIWCAVDRTLYLLLHSARAIEIDENTPSFAQPPSTGIRRSFNDWFIAWLGREALAFPIWFFAFWAGTQVEWRGKKFWVGMDMKVHEIPSIKSRVN